MIRDVVSFEKIWRRLHGASSTNRAIPAFVSYLEKKFGFEALYDEELFPYGRDDLVDLFDLAEQLKEHGVIRSFTRQDDIPDEPRLTFWNARYRDAEDEAFSGGCALDDDRHAFTCALAEGLERHIWFERDDYFKGSRVATMAQMAHRKKLLSPERFAGFSEQQRKENRNLMLSPEKEFLWIRGISLFDNSPIWVPAQTISASAKVTMRRRNGTEPLIRRVVTTGLSTHPDRTQALLSGALEIIERDAYMITWLNHLSPPRVNVDALCEQYPSLKKIIDVCRRYRLQPYILRLPTDAPAFAIAAVVKDETGNGPIVSLGLKAHANIAIAAEKAIVEALRGRRGARAALARNEKHETAATVGHYDRLAYWADTSRSNKLAFLMEGPIDDLPDVAWIHDTKEQHLQRIVSWCRVRNYGCASVALTSSQANCTPWHIEMVVIPELQPLYYSESLPHIGGRRLTEIPTLFGYKVRQPFFTEEPHPFA